jgi:hypothetical protein
MRSFYLLLRPEGIVQFLPRGVPVGVDRRTIMSLWGNVDLILLRKVRVLPLHGGCGGDGGQLFFRFNTLTRLQNAGYPLNTLLPRRYLGKALDFV